MSTLSIASVFDAYQSAGGSVHKAGALLGISHSTVHRRLTKAGLINSKHFTDDEVEAIRQYYTTTPVDQFDLKRFSNELQRPVTSISRVARSLGVTDPRRPERPQSRQKISDRMAQQWKVMAHPRGALGIKHSEETRAVLSAKSKAAWLVAKTFNVGAYAPELRQAASDRMSRASSLKSGANAYSRCASGIREDIGPMYFRSKWEANYARYLNWLQQKGEIESWEYEPVTFWFEAIKRGVRSYKPDFRVKEKGREYFVEVKGWMDPRSKTKLARMKRYHPSIEVRVVGEKQYRSIKNAVAGIVPGWEP